MFFPNLLKAACGLAVTFSADPGHSCSAVLRHQPLSLPPLVLGTTGSQPHFPFALPASLLSIWPSLSVPPASGPTLVPWPGSPLLLPPLLPAYPLGPAPGRWLVCAWWGGRFRPVSGLHRLGPPREARSLFISLSSLELSRSLLLRLHWAINQSLGATTKAGGGGPQRLWGVGYAWAGKPRTFCLRGCSVQGGGLLYPLAPQVQGASAQWASELAPALGRTVSHCPGSVVLERVPLEAPPG